jgi:SET domain-containing protein
VSSCSELRSKTNFLFV